MLKVLIVDDEQFVRVSLRTLYDWESNGFEIVDTADDGLDALEKIERHRPDIVITDIAMPNMDGLALLEEIGARKISCVTLVISNLGDVKHVKRAIKLGAEDYYLKVDFERDEFHSLMQRLGEAALQKKAEGAAAAPARAPQARNVAALLAAAMENGDFSGLDHAGPLHVFCIRMKEYMSETLCTFQSVYQSLGNIVKEVFRSEPSVSFARAAGRDAVLVAVSGEIPAATVADRLKRLDGQIQVYLQVRPDVLHFSSAGPEGFRILFQKLAELDSYFSKDGDPPLLWDDDSANNDADVIDHVIRYIEDNISRHISLNEIAGHINLNPSYLSRVFSQKTGMPLIQYITEEKMKRAALLLRSGNYRVKEVAALLGISDQYYFTKLFYKVFQVNPSEYMASERDLGR